MKTKIEKKKNDTRELFWRLTVRKPYDYVGIPVRPHLNAAQVEVLRGLKLVDLGGSATCDKFQRKTPLEFVGQLGTAYFYINTEGFDYPRYAFRLSTHPQQLQAGLSHDPEEIKAFANVVKNTLQEEKHRLSPWAIQVLEDALLQIGAL